MAENKMLRVAAVKEDGTATPFRVSNDGNLKTDTTSKKVFSSVTVPASGEVLVVAQKAEGFTGFRLAATGLASGMTGLIFVYSSADSEANLFNADRAYVLETEIKNLGDTRNFHSKDYPIHGRYLGIKIKNTTTSARSPHSITLTLKQDGIISEPPAGVLIETFTTLSSGSTKGANSLVMHVEPGTPESKGVYVEGRTGSGSYKRIPAVDSKRMLRTDALNELGVYYYDMRGFDFFRTQKVSGVDTTTFTAFLSKSEPLQPLDTPVRYKRITPADNEVYGKFRAIEPLTDITIHANTVLLSEYNANFSDVSNSVFENGDTRLVGQTLFGPFSRVRISSGSALLVLL